MAVGVGNTIFSIMHRRNFLSGTGVVALTAGTAPILCAKEAEESLNWEKVTSLKHYVAKCERATDGDYPDIKLEVRLEDLKTDEFEQQGFLRLFRLTWSGKEIPIPNRFWADLNRLEVQDYPKAEIARWEKDSQWRALHQLDDLKKPRLSLSCDGGTVLIEWKRSEECDSSSTIQWIIAKSGTVLRHRYQKYHEC
jgi:hypothetical protein